MNLKSVEWTVAPISQNALIDSFENDVRERGNLFEPQILLNKALAFYYAEKFHSEWNLNQYTTIRFRLSTVLRTITAMQLFSETSSNENIVMIHDINWDNQKDTSFSSFLVHDTITAFSTSNRIPKFDFIFVMTFCEISNDEIDINREYSILRNDIQY